MQNRRGQLGSSQASAKLDLRTPRNREDAFAQVRGRDTMVGALGGGVFLGRPLPTAPLLAETNRLRQL
jgi:hypothetical protein